MEATDGRTQCRRARAVPRALSGLLLILATLVALPPVAAQEPAESQEPEITEGSEEERQPEEETGEEAPVEEIPVEDRLRFEVPFTDESGGGTAVVLAEELELEGDAYVLIGRVEIEYQDIKLKADRAELDRSTKIVTAIGNIILDQGPSRLVGATMSFDLEEKTGRLTDARGFVSADYFFSGAEIIKTGEKSFTVIDGIFTSCDQDVPSWSFRTGRTDLVVDGYAKTRGATMRVKKAPVLYFPYLLWPVKSDRSSGMLVPKPGFSERRGTALSLAYYQTLGPSYDTTVYLDLFSEDYLGIGNEFRYQPTEATGGRFDGYWIQDPDRGEDRWRTQLTHESRDLPWGFRGVIRYDDVSDFDYFQDFERNADRHAKRALHSNAFLTKNWGRQSFNFLVDQRETFLRDNSTVSLRQMPEVEYRLRSTQLRDLPLYLQLNSAFHFLDVDRRENYNDSYMRANFAPRLTFPYRAFPWLSFSVDAGAVFTFWGDSLRVSGDEPDPESDSVFRSESLSRITPSISGEAVGPSFSRIFDLNGKTWSKLKHIMEPRFNYAFVDEFDEEDRIPRFDELDSIRGANIGRMAFINRLLAKPAGEGGGGSREIMSVEIFRLYSFDDDRFLQRSSDGEKQSHFGPPTLLFRYNPTRQTTFRNALRFNTLFGRIESSATSGSFEAGPHRFGVRWTARIRPDDGMTRTNQFRVSSDLILIPRRLRLISSVNFDANDSLVQLQRHILEYNANCWGVRLEFGEFKRRGGQQTDREFRFSINLKNVGTFLDLTGGESSSL